MGLSILRERVVGFPLGLVSFISYFEAVWGG